MNSEQKKEHWGSRLGVVLAVAGGAVGLGNFLRFPGQVVNYGGGAFMIPYMISLLIVAIPLAGAEWALGRCGGRQGYHSTLGIYYGVGKKPVCGVFGGLATIIPTVINMYYIIIEAWCFLYAAQYLGGCLKPLGLGFSIFPEIGVGLNLDSSEAYAKLFGDIVGIGANGSTLFSVLFVGLACILLNFALIYCGISKGIERFSKIAAPLIIVCSVLIMIRVVTLGNPTGIEGQSFLDGLGFMWNPTRNVLDASGQVVGQTTLMGTLSNPETWLAATSQIFFTASLCLGSTCSYASYVRPNEDIALSSLTATAANEFCEVGLAGVMIVPPAIMFLGAQASSSFGSSFALGFMALPNVFGMMPLGQLCGFVFFVLLFFAAITSSASLAQPTCAFFKESLGWSSGKAAAFSVGLTTVGAAIVCLFSKDLVALDSFDFWLSNFGPFLFAVFQTLFIAWIWGTRSAQEELDRGALFSYPKLTLQIVKWVSLPYLTLIFLFWCYKELDGRLSELAEKPVAQFSVGFILCILFAYFLISCRAVKRWKREENATDSKE